MLSEISDSFMARLTQMDLLPCIRCQVRSCQDHRLLSLWERCIYIGLTQCSKESVRFRDVTFQVKESCVPELRDVMCVAASKRAS